MNEKQLQIFQVTNNVNRASEIGCLKNSDLKNLDLENSDLQTSDLEKSDLQTSDPLKSDWNYMNEYLFMKIIMTNPSVKSHNNPALIIADR